MLTVVGMAMLALMQTEANIFAFSMVNVIVTFILAGITGVASLYDRVGSAAAAAGRGAVPARSPATA